MFEYSIEFFQDLDLDAFADELERQGFGNKRTTLYDIRSELNHRYKDGRQPFQPPSAEDIFNMVTKETPQTFFIGKLVMATVTGFQNRKPKREELDTANPNRNDATGLWQCPFCLQVSPSTSSLIFQLESIDWTPFFTTFSRMISPICRKFGTILMPDRVAAKRSACGFVWRTDCRVSFR